MQVANLVMMMKASASGSAPGMPKGPQLLNWPVIIAVLPRGGIDIQLNPHNGRCGEQAMTAGAGLNLNARD